VDDDTVRLAYQHLFTTLSLDPAPEAAGELAGAVREALVRYPDLVPEQEYCPRSIITLVQAVRLQMYGALEVAKPDGADVFLDGELRGRSPLALEFVPVGKRELMVAKKGFKDRRETITIEPGARLVRDFELDARGGRRWYIAGGLAVTGIVWALLSGSDDPVPLPDPPPPPATR
jgi:hypothetical protein